ncbi:branched-chain amino acid ABC transporter permease [Actinoallomurus sp. CA-150999]|uniref:branched-chain amino acid ABC transporter permease n=1 Tax=Actinoallomurus sp. CA-150999 TaxID=3239887 RepID=UPI003D9365FD
MTTTQHHRSTGTPVRHAAGPGAALPLSPAVARALTTTGGLLTAASALLSWTWTARFPGDLTISGYPGGLQWLTVTAGILTCVYGLACYRVRGLRWPAPAAAGAPALLLAIGGLCTTWFTLGAISIELGGLVNLTAGGWIAGIAALIPVIGALGLPFDEPVPNARNRAKALWHHITHRREAIPARPLPAYAEAGVVIAVVAVGLAVFTYGIDTSYDELFIGFGIFVAFGAWALRASGVLERLSAITERRRAVAMFASLAAALAFPFTQSSDEYTSVGVNILIFATVALGLNIVVGLTGLLDLGYVAFLGVGAYTAALVSGAATSSIHVVFPWWAAALTGAVAAMVFGIVIGAPTLRLRGDYLAIVTLGFGEIFRIAVNNLDGTSGPNVTGGPNGIPNIPDISIFGYNLGESHDVGGFTLGRFANYYLLMLVFTAIVVLVFGRARDSRIGRAWIAIREDETAAQAMGINGFRFKLLAFALGAALAGLAGMVQAHVAFSVVPDPYQFTGTVPPNSAFLLAAVVLGGMGSVSGPLLGAVLLYLIPAKLQFLQNFQLLAFGITLILLMRFRPEGLIPNRLRQREFHEFEDGGDLTTAGTVTRP